MACLTDTSSQPQEYIHRAQCMLRFLSLALCEQRGQTELPEFERDGLYWILDHIEANLKQAQSLIH